MIIGLVGCGAMGGGMIIRLIERGHHVICHDALPEARARMKRTGAMVCDDLSGLAERCEIIILSLPRAAIVEHVMSTLGPKLHQGTTVLDTSTSEPETTKLLARKADSSGYTFIDGPVSGGPSGARNGTMTMMLGGDANIIAKMQPMLEDIAKTIVHVGPVGSGHAIKIANNLICAANLVLVSEMAHLASCSGVSLENLLAGINAGSGGSSVSEVNFPRWILDQTYDSGFTMGLMRKDVGLAMLLVERAGLNLPATSMIAQIWKDSRDMLPDSADFNEIFKYGIRKNV